MTVIAFDGETLAADRRLSNGSTIVGSVTKIHRFNYMLVGVSGDMALAQEIIQWARDGFNPEKIPAFQRTDKFVALLVIKKDGIYKYEDSPYPYKIESPFYAIGSGRDFALTAMHLGKSAVEAVEVACALDPGCGNGIDSMML